MSGNTVIRWQADSDDTRELGDGLALVHSTQKIWGGLSIIEILAVEVWVLKGDLQVLCAEVDLDLAFIAIEINEIDHSGGLGPRIHSLMAICEWTWRLNEVDDKVLGELVFARVSIDGSFVDGDDSDARHVGGVSMVVWGFADRSENSGKGEDKLLACQSSSNKRK